jgi:glycosyltransferase involved in cell wall biosynthesis
MSAPAREDVGVVVIGRNEGLRLKICLESVIGRATHVVYVDSGSTDGSVETARGLGASVVELDMNVPFTAARARNAGLEELLERAHDLRFVQFVDGDCEVVSDWLDKALEFLEQRADVAVVCGRRRERYPDASIYNALCDIEWNTPVGEARYCGGDALMRVAALRAVNGYRPDMIAGEEPELCVRLRAHGWKIWRLDADMTLHDAAMTRFHQWWKRTKRAGHAFAHGAYLHGAPPVRHSVTEVRRACFWGFGLPVVTLVLSALLSPAFLLLLLAYPAQVIRLGLRADVPKRSRWPHAALLVLGKFPEFLGVLKFHLDRLVGRRSYLIEYK